MLVFGGQDFEDAQVALDFVGGGLGEQVNDLRLVLLAVAVHPAIALLEDHERPRQVEVHQAVAEVVQVQALAGHVRAQQDAHGVVQAAKAVHQFLLFGVGHLAMQHGQLVGLHLQVGSELLLQPAQGFNAFGEDDEAVCGVVGFPGEVGRAQVGQQALVLAEAGG